MSVSSCNRLAEATPFSLVHSDIIQTHILPRLDGPDLASTSCVSSELHSISTQEKLWKHIAIETWPSIDHPRVQRIISTFASGHRSFFSDAFPFPISHEQRPMNTMARMSHHDSSNMISAVDIKYGDEIVYSRVHDTGLVTGWLENVLFWVSLIDPKESVSTSIPIFTTDDANQIKTELEESLTMSWILIDPSLKRAVNLSSLRPVSIQRHWMTGEIQVRYATILFNADDDADCSDLVQCGILVTCSRSSEGEQMSVKEVRMQMEDTGGRIMNGDESLAILRGALESGRGKRKEETKKYEHYIDIKIERIKKKRGRDCNFDILGICIGATLLVTIVLSVFFLLISFKVNAN